MNMEVWGDPQEGWEWEPNPCELCDEEMGSTADCNLCREFNRADRAEYELYRLRSTLAHRLRILRTRDIYKGGNPKNGVSVELIMAMNLLLGIKGVLYPHEFERSWVAEAERALLTNENARYKYPVQPGCNCLHSDKPHPAIHAESCPYRIQYGAVYSSHKQPK